MTRYHGRGPRQSLGTGDRDSDGTRGTGIVMGQKKNYLRSGGVLKNLKAGVSELFMIGGKLLIISKLLICVSWKRVPGRIQAV